MDLKGKKATVTLKMERPLSDEDLKELFPGLKEGETVAIVPRDEKVIIEENLPILTIELNEQKVTGMSDFSPDFGDVGLFVDKVTEAAKLGTGAFMDFGDLLGLTEDETQELAKSLMLMSLDEMNDKISEVIDNAEIPENKEHKLFFVLESLFDLSLEEANALSDKMEKEMISHIKIIETEDIKKAIEDNIEKDIINVIKANSEEIKKLLS